MSRAIVNKLLHHPTTRIKQSGEKGDEVLLVSALRRLFGLESDD
jgi:glutamyl-tRNA reductase